MQVRDMIAELESMTLGQLPYRESYADRAAMLTGVLTDLDNLVKAARRFRRTVKRHRDNYLALQAERASGT